MTSASIRTSGDVDERVAVFAPRRALVRVRARDAVAPARHLARSEGAFAGRQARLQIRVVRAVCFATVEGHPALARAGGHRVEAYPRRRRLRLRIRRIRIRPRIERHVRVRPSLDRDRGRRRRGTVARIARTDERYVGHEPARASRSHQKKQNHEAQTSSRSRHARSCPRVSRGIGHVRAMHVEWREMSRSTNNRVGTAGIFPRPFPPTPPDVRVRIRRFSELRSQRASASRGRRSRRPGRRR